MNTERTGRELAYDVAMDRAWSRKVTAERAAQMDYADAVDRATQDYIKAGEK